MTNKTGQGQADKKAAEQRTADAAEAPGDTAGDAVVDTAAAQKVERIGETDAAGAAVINPFPAYETLALADLRSAAEARGVAINRDVEKAHLVMRLREKVPDPAYDLMPLDQLRDEAGKHGIGLDAEFERAQLVTELRAADTHT